MEQLVMSAVHNKAKTKELTDIPAPIIESVACEAT
jgi:hypothetical protein